MYSWNKSFVIILQEESCDSGFFIYMFLYFRSKNIKPKTTLCNKINTALFDNQLSSSQIVHLIHFNADVVDNSVVHKSFI